MILLPIVLLAVAAPSLQQSVDRAMAGRSGTAVVMDVASGRILAAYQPEIAGRRRARPGSTVKPFTMLTLLNAHRIRPSTTRICHRRLFLEGRDFECSHPVTPLPLDPASALAYSCNQFFTTFAARLQPADLAATFRRVGLGDHNGSVVTLARTESLQLQAIGEAGIEVTPLGLLEAYRRLAQRRTLPDIDEGIRMIYRGLEGATTYGTARLATPKGIRVAGKTGTASETGIHWKHAWFAGYAPPDHPKVAVVVFLERGLGGADAAPVAALLFQAALAGGTNQGTLAYIP